MYLSSFDFPHSGAPFSHKLLLLGDFFLHNLQLFFVFTLLHITLAFCIILQTIILIIKKGHFMPQFDNKYFVVISV
jgi:hypothetical protein